MFLVRRLLLIWYSVIFFLTLCLIYNFYKLQNYINNLERLRAEYFVLINNVNDFTVKNNQKNVIHELPLVQENVKTLEDSVKPKSKTASSRGYSSGSSKGFIWPIEKSCFWVSSKFGPRKKLNGSWGYHFGIDMAAIKGTKVVASHSGIVSHTGYDSGYGKNIIIKHENNIKTRYAHLDKIFVPIGAKVKKNELIGKVGSTGFVRSSKKGTDPSHLHFEVLVSGKHVNPGKFLGSC